MALFTTAFPASQPRIDPGSDAGSVIEENSHPGQRQLQWILCGAYSSAMVFVISTTEPFEAA